MIPTLLKAEGDSSSASCYPFLIPYNKELALPIKVFKSQNCCSPANPPCWSGLSVVTVAKGDCLTSAFA